MNAFGHTRLGILGGGQLGRMLIQKAIDYNIATFILDPDPDAPCREICTGFVNGSFKNFDTVIEFGKTVDIITVEIEHVNVDALEELEKMGKRVYPQPSVLRIVQDKGMQKEFYSSNGIPTSGFVLVHHRLEIKDHEIMFPVMQKLRRSGYDGRGVKPLRYRDDIETAFDEPSILEKLVPFEREIAVIVSRNDKGEVAAFPVVDLEFNSEANLVEFLYSPSSVSRDVADRATAIAKDVITKLEMTGLLAVEMFLEKDGNILVNEIAPRPHNSGHHTIEGNVTSQYEQHLRAILGLPPGDTSVVQPAVMVNLLGEKDHNGDAIYEGVEDVLAISGAHIHLYGKKNTKPFRKMGHITVTAHTIEDARKNAQRIQKILKVKSK